MRLERLILRKSARRAHEVLKRKVREALSNSTQRNVLANATDHIRQKIVEGYAEASDSKSLLSTVRQIKRRSTARLSELVSQFTENAKRNGVHVYYAGTKSEAVSYVTQVLSQAKANLVVKSKSMVCEELSLNEHLSAAGFEVVETDLGERIVQLAGERPSHIVAPAIHLTVGQIAQVFSRSLKVGVAEAADEIARVARRSLREKFLKADAGITGANFLVAEDASIELVTNEGNGRLVTSLPRIHIVVTAIDKIVPTFKDALNLTQALCLSAIGHRLTSYVTIFRAPGTSAKGETREMHVVLLDNNRSRAAQDSVFKQALYCLKCASCLDVCPTYRQVGGHVFGSTYTGPIGIPWTAMTEGNEVAAGFAPLCFSCGLCRLVCPTDINIPLLIAQVKAKDVKRNGQLPVNWVLARYESFVKVLSATAPLSNALMANSGFRWLLEQTVGIDRRRRFPRFTRRSFRKRFHEMPSGKEVVYFADTYANYNRPELGAAAVRVLTNMGYRVLFPPQKGSGMPAFLYGELEVMRKIAEFNVKSVLPYARRGIPTVATEPTAAFCLKELYPEILRTADARVVAENSFEILGFIQSKGIVLNAAQSRNGTVVYHTPCHTRSLYAEAPGPQLLRQAGLDVQIVDHYGCCGIAGTYGFKKGVEGFELSMAVGEELFRKISDLKSDYVCTESSVCRMQIEQAMGLDVKHPLEILDELHMLPPTASNTWPDPLAERGIATRKP